MLTSSSCCPSAGSSSAPSRGSRAVVDWPRTGNASTVQAASSCGGPPSGSWSGNYVRPPDDPGWTLTAQIVAAHVEHNTVRTDALPDLIKKVYQTLRGVGQAAVEPERPTPAVPIKQSVKPEFIICLEDGRKLKMLK